MSIKLMKDSFESGKNDKAYLIEKMDMVFFKIRFDQIGCTVLKSPGFLPLTKIDYITNDMYVHITDFCNMISEYASEVLRTFGDCEVGFFYLPCKKAHVINYDTLEPGSFYIGSIYIDDKDILYEYDPDERYVGPLKGISDILHLPNVIIREIELDSVMRDYISSYKLGNITDLQMSRILLGSFGTVSGLSLDSIEGLIIYVGKRKYQIVLNDTTTNVDKDSVKIYRDFVIRDFVNIMLKENAVLTEKILNEKRDSPISHMMLLFSSYMNMTQLFKRYTMLPEDLLPPHEGYFGELNMEYITYPMAKLICDYVPVGKNVFRILLHTFCQKEIDMNKFSDFTDDDKELIKKFIAGAKINYLE